MCNYLRHYVQYSDFRGCSVKKGLLSVDGLLHRIRAQSPSKPTLSGLCTDGWSPFTLPRILHGVPRPESDVWHRYAIASQGCHERYQRWRQVLIEKKSHSRLMPPSCDLVPVASGAGLEVDSCEHEWKRMPDQGR